MGIFVENVTRGMIFIRSENLEIKVSGEGLIPPKNGMPSYVVYLNSINIKKINENYQLNNNINSDIINCIELYFSKKGMIVDFE